VAKSQVYRALGRPGSRPVPVPCRQHVCCNLHHGSSLCRDFKEQGGQDVAKIQFLGRLASEFDGLPSPVHCLTTNQAPYVLLASIDFGNLWQLLDLPLMGLDTTSGQAVVVPSHRSVTHKALA
jgi:hypothetical protein